MTVRELINLLHVVDESAELMISVDHEDIMPVEEIEVDKFPGSENVVCLTVETV